MISSVRTRSIWRWQLVLAAATVTVAAAIALLDPARFGEPTFLGGITAIVALTGASLLVPWERVPSEGVVALPIANIAAIALLSIGGQSPASLLWVFPIAWIATYYRLPWLGVGLGFVAVFLTAEVFASGLSPLFTQRAIIILLCLGFIGITINTGSRRARAYSRLLRRQFAQLDRTRERAEHQARRTALLADSLETGLARIDRDGVLIDANAAFLQYFGAHTFTDFSPTGAVEYDDHRGQPVGRHETFIARAAAGESWRDRRVWLYDARAQWRALDVMTRPVVADEVEHDSNLIIVRDVTASVEAERARANVSAVVSHELRNPLTAILGYTDLLLERDDLPADIARQLGVIEHAGQRMERLVTSVLEGKDLSEQPHKAVDLRTVIEASLLAFGPTATSALVDLSHDLADSRDVFGDAFRLRQAIDNIVSNAVKYTGRGGSVHVSASHTASDTAVTFTDSGIGMSEHDRERLFERGYRSEAARSSGVAGTGIGMSVVKEIVDQHEGSLEVTSNLGRGTHITLTLPRIPADSAAADSAVPADTRERMP